MRVNEIFQSISGEAGNIPQGTWATFFRLQGCNLKCKWCDAKNTQSKDGGEEIPINILLSFCNTTNILITGGEPLLQEEELIEFTDNLKTNHRVQIETNGTIIPSSRFSNRITWVFDYKLKGSGNTSKNRPIGALCSVDSICPIYIKFVVSGISELEELTDSLSILYNIKREKEPLPFIFPVISVINSDNLLMRTIMDSIYKINPVLLNDTIFSVQTHKIIGLK